MNYRKKSNMKKIVLLILLLVPIISLAQIDESKMEKYLAPLQMEGTKVVFKDSLQFKDISADKVYQIAAEWADAYIAKFDKKFESRIAYKNEEKKSVVMIFNRDIVFRDISIILDKALMKCNITIDIVGNKCIIKVLNIKYDYVEGGLTEHYKADEWIIDRYAINRDRTKLAKTFGKFRAKTIDAVDEIFESFNLYMFEKVSATPIEEEVKVEEKPVKIIQPKKVYEPAGAPAQSAASTAATTAATVAASTVATAAATTTPAAKAPVADTPVAKQEVVATPANVSAASGLQGYKNIAPEKIPGNFIKMLSQDWMLITAGNKDKFNMMTASWGGFGVLYNKPVVFCFINPARYTYKVIETQGDTFTITFYTEMYRDALNYCGTKSGKDEDKVKGSGLTPVQMPTGGMAFEQAWMIIECKKLVSQSLLPDSINNSEVKSNWLDKPMHKMYIGEIVNVWVK